MHVTEENEFIVMNPVETDPDIDANVKMEVGIENFIQLEYEIFRNKFVLDDCILGKIYFIKINIPVKSMEIILYKKETIVNGSNKLADNTVVGKYEILDGSPNESDIIPIRMYLDCYELTPSYKLNDFDASVEYFLKFVVIDNNDKNYFKQQDIFLWRKTF
jgi:vacuolar protein sorting-associated protein 26